MVLGPATGDPGAAGLRGVLESVINIGGRAVEVWDILGRYILAPESNPQFKWITCISDRHQHSGPVTELRSVESPLFKTS